MNPRQRRGALLLIVAAVGALALVIGLSAYIADVQSQLGPMARQLRLVNAVTYLEPITPDDVEVVEVPARFNSEGALTDGDDLAGRVASADLPAGTMLQRASVVDPPQISAGEREVAILVAPETGVGGKIQAGDLVDVYATFEAGTVGEGERARTRAARAEVVLQAVRIVDVAPAVAAGDDAFSEGVAVPVTFALDATESLRLAYAESFATELRLGLRTRTDVEDLPDDAIVYEEEG